MDRISQVVLIVVGLLALAVLTVGLAVSCREPAPSTGPTPTPTLPGATATPFPPASATPPGLPPADLTATAGAPIPSEVTATPTPPAASPTPGGASPAPEGPSPTPPAGATAAPPPGATAAPVPPTAPPGALTPGTTVRHTVVRGEWLLQIGRCYGAPYGGILLANRIPNPDLIYPDQIVIVPSIGTAGRIIGPPCVQAYFVQAGDTWESLATRFGTTTAILRRANPGELAVARAIWAPRN